MSQTLSEFKRPLVPKTLATDNVGILEGWGEEFVNNYYRWWFETEKSNMNELEIGTCIFDCGQEPGRVLVLSKSAEIIDKLISETHALSQDLVPNPVLPARTIWPDRHVWLH